MTASPLLRTALASALALALTALPAQAQVPPPVDKPYPGTLTVRVDATNLNQQLFRVRETIPVAAGHNVLLFPQWLPGKHAPRGALPQLGGLTFTANGKRVTWKRDDYDMYAFHIDVPAGAATVEAEWQYLSPSDTAYGRITMTSEILGVQWENMVLYPAGYNASRVTVQPTLTLPAGWQYGTALETEARAGDEVRFKPVDLVNLIDSPLFAGRHFKRYDLDPGGRAPVHLNVAGDDAAAVEAKPEQIAAHRNLVQQAYKLFNSHHYQHYDFLLSISEDFGGIGLEHHQSSENGVKPGYFTEWNKREIGRDLLPHEFTHSWNGKFRRPAGQKVPNFNTPLQNSLLWVYEGQTMYWGEVLAARSGLMSQQQIQDALAATAATYDNQQGRAWRAMADTTNDPIINARRPIAWSNWQRGEDYYSEGMLIWLDVDTKIRELSGDKRSLNDFARAFYGVNDGSYEPAHYTFEDVVKYLNGVQPHDWATFLKTRVEGHGPGAPLDGFTRGGWKLVYTEQPTQFFKDQEERNKSSNFTYSLGFAVDKDGKLKSVSWDGPAFKAGLAVDHTIVGVNGKTFKVERLKAAIAANKSGKEPIELLLRKGEALRTVKFDYTGGLRYPRLERIPGTPDRLHAILQPMK